MAAPNGEALADDAAPTESPDDSRKAFETMRARAALAGCALHRLADGEFLLCRWGMSRACPDLRSVAALLARLQP